MEISSPSTLKICRSTGPKFSASSENPQRSEPRAAGERHMRTYHPRLTQPLRNPFVGATMFGIQLAETTSWVSWALADWEGASSTSPDSRYHYARKIPLFGPNRGKQNGMSYSLSRQSSSANNHREEPQQDKDSNEKQGDNKRVGTGGGEGGLRSPHSGKTFTAAPVHLQDYSWAAPRSRGSQPITRTNGI